MIKTIIIYCIVEVIFIPYIFLSNVAFHLTF